MSGATQPAGNAQAVRWGFAWFVNIGHAGNHIPVNINWQSCSSARTEKCLAKWGFIIVATLKFNCAENYFFATNYTDFREFEKKIRAN
jgi:hypothetical protein